MNWERYKSRSHRRIKMPEFTVKLKGFQLFLYLKKRFEYTNSQAIKNMVKHNQDISFLDKLPL